MLAALALMSVAAMTQAPPAMKLWPSGNPEGWKRPDVEKSQGDPMFIEQISEPTIALYPAKDAKPGAPTVVIFPGGGYNGVAIVHEGWEIAEFLNKQGFHAAVVKYRIPNRGKDEPIHRIPLQDAQRAIRIVRSKAAELKLDPAKVGVMGFSAGGHLAAMASTTKDAAYAPVDAVDTQPIRPAFTILIYPAYLDTAGKAVLAPEVKVDAQTPPAFLVHAADDWIPLESSLAYGMALKNAKVSVEMHTYGTGGHGYGLRSDVPSLKDWPTHLAAWLRSK